MSDIEALESLGLSEAEAKVYLALLEQGSTLAGPIIKKTGLHRGTTYQIIQRLIGKGLVSFVTKGKKRYFEAAAPARFEQILREKAELLKEMMPRLEQKRQFSREKQEINVYSGYKGIKTVCDNILENLKYGGEYLDFGVSGLFREVMGPYWDLWQRRKKRYKIRAKCIFDEALKKENPQLLKDYYGEARFHPTKFRSITDTVIYKDTVVLFIWTAKPTVAVVVKNKENAESYRNQFNMMWRMAKKK